MIYAKVPLCCASRLRDPSVIWLEILCLDGLFLFCSYSSAFTSVHGERPSSDYAKIRKASLETQFGRILGSSSRRLFADRGFGPFLALYRAATISFHVVKLTMWHLLLNDMHKRAEKVVFLFLPGGELSIMSLIIIFLISVPRDLDTLGSLLHQGTRRYVQCNSNLFNSYYFDI